MLERYLRLAAVCGLCFLPLVQRATGQSPAAPAAAVERTVEVYVLAYSTAADGTEHGSLYPTQITVGGRNDGKPRVGFLESEVSATGAQWRSAGWSAALTAAQLSDFNPLAMQVTYTFEGRLDGPSAGALMTIGVLAAVRGDTPRADAAMTGTINPDGTIGPVGGIIHKIAGAAAAGKKLVLIPSDSRIQRDKSSNEDVDLVAHGRKLGVEVQQVSDIYTAYHLMTGKELPRPERPDRLSVSHDVNEMIKIKFKFWLDHYKTALQKIADLREQPGGADEEGDEDQGTEELLSEAAEQAKRAQKLLNEGKFSAAYCDALFAAVKGYLAMERCRCRQAFRNTGIEGTIARVRNNQWLKNEIEVVGGQLRAKPPRTFDQLDMYLESCSAFIETLSYQALAEEQLAALPTDDEDKAYSGAVDAAQNQIIAWLDLQVVRDDLDFIGLEAGQSIPAEAPVMTIADFYRRGAQANHAVFEALVIEPTAAAVGAPARAIRSMLDSKDERYAISRVLQEKVRDRLNKHFGDSPARRYAELALALSMYVDEASLLARYYSLSAELDESMEITDVKSEGTLNDWLEFSEDQTRRNLGALARRGINPTAGLQLCEMAHMMRLRELDDKLNAIGYLWHANLTAGIVRYLSGDRAAP